MTGGDSSSTDGGNAVVSIPPFHYIHVLDRNTNITKLVTGPATYVRKGNERYFIYPFGSSFLALYKSR